MYAVFWDLISHVSYMMKNKYFSSSSGFFVQNSNVPSDAITLAITYVERKVKIFV